MGCHVACMGDIRNVYKLSVKENYRTRPVGR
jgi:hypothetical protein